MEETAKFANNFNKFLKDFRLKVGCVHILCCIYLFIISGWKKI